MMLVRRADPPGRAWEHHQFRELPSLLRAGDLLVVNESRVRPVRLQTFRQGSKGRIELLLLAEIEIGQWNALLCPSRRLRVGDRLEVPGEEGFFEVKEKGSYGLCRLKSHFPAGVDALCELCGLTPLPPYIKRHDSSSEEEDRGRYQTIFARRPGSVAAPTAGLHFTEGVLQELARAGVEVCPLTLHVGLATFQPVRVTQIEQHRLEPERYSIPEETAGQILCAKSEGRRVIAVGTTTTRALESVAARNSGRLVAGAGQADIFIHPPQRFRVIDGLLTNFHLPRSSLLVLVAAFAGRELILDCYQEAIRRQYRFYSYGDCMLIL